MENYLLLRFLNGRPSGCLFMASNCASNRVSCWLSDFLSILFRWKKKNTWHHAIRDTLLQIILSTMYKTRVYAVKVRVQVWFVKVSLWLDIIIHSTHHTYPKMKRLSGCAKSRNSHKISSFQCIYVFQILPILLYGCDKCGVHAVVIMLLGVFFSFIP